jgi:hypothetical protein
MGSLGVVLVQCGVGEALEGADVTGSAVVKSSTMELGFTEKATGRFEYSLPIAPAPPPGVGSYHKTQISRALTLVCGARTLWWMRTVATEAVAGNVLCAPLLALPPPGGPAAFGACQVVFKAFTYFCMLKLGVDAATLADSYFLGTYDVSVKATHPKLGNRSTKISATAGAKIPDATITYPECPIGGGGGQGGGGDGGYCGSATLNYSAFGTMPAFTVTTGLSFSIANGAIAGTYGFTATGSVAADGSTTFTAGGGGTPGTFTGSFIGPFGSGQVSEASGGSGPTGTGEWNATRFASGLADPCNVAGTWRFECPAVACGSRGQFPAAAGTLGICPPVAASGGAVNLMFGTFDPATCRITAKQPGLPASLAACGAPATYTISLRSGTGTGNMPYADASDTGCNCGGARPCTFTRQ